MLQNELLLHPSTEKIFSHILDKPPHALIIEGATGTGVTTVAKAIARHLGSPEIVIKPKKKKDSIFVVDEIDGSIVIEDIRALYEQTRGRLPGKIVYILDTGFKSLTLGAQNAFLKLLEEPRDNVHFIIATHQPEKLLPTIISRCQTLSLANVTNEQSLQLIDSFGETEVLRKQRLVFVGRGRPALIHKLQKDKNLYEERVQIMSDAKILLGNNTYEKMSVIQRYKDSRTKAVMLLDDANHQLKAIVEKSHNKQLIMTIDRYLHARERIVAGGNIRLQLASSVL